MHPSSHDKHTLFFLFCVLYSTHTQNKDLLHWVICITKNYASIPPLLFSSSTTHPLPSTLHLLPLTTLGSNVRFNTSTMAARKAGVTDYSKWDNIELSDDESDCHPNIEKGTWFRLKHQQRLDREKEEAKERETLEATIATASKLEDTTLDAAERKKIEEDVEKAQARIAKMDKNKKWNVDNMCKTVSERTIVNHEVSLYITLQLSICT